MAVCSSGQTLYWWSTVHLCVPGTRLLLDCKWSGESLRVSDSITGELFDKKRVINFGFSWDRMAEAGQSLTKGDVKTHPWTVEHDARWRFAGGSPGPIGG